MARKEYQLRATTTCACGRPAITRRLHAPVCVRCLNIELYGVAKPGPKAHKLPRMGRPTTHR